MDDKNFMAMFVEQSQTILKLKDENYNLKFDQKQLQQSYERNLHEKALLIKENEQLKQAITILNSLKG